MSNRNRLHVHILPRDFYDFNGGICMNVSLKQFLQTGKLGELHVGMKGNEVLRLLGESDFPDKGDQNEDGHWS